MTDENKRGSRLSLNEFEAAVKNTRLTPASVEVANLVLVNGKSQVYAADLHGLTESRVSKIVSTVWNAHKERVNEGDMTLNVSRDPRVALVQADFDVLIMSLRKEHGDQVEIKQAESARSQHTGDIIHKTDFFAVQTSGKSGILIHRLSQLDVSPKVGSVATIVYTNGQGTVVSRVGKALQSSLER